MGREGRDIKDLMAKLEPCFGTLCCSDQGKNPLLCPLEAQCSNKWLKEWIRNRYRQGEK